MMKADNQNIDVVEPNDDFRVAVIVADFNKDFTDALLDFCIEGLVDCKISKENIGVFRVPGSFELPFAAKKMAHSGKFHSVICLGVIIRGETNHFDLVSDCTARGIMQLNLESPIPVIFGVLSCENILQAKNRLSLGKEYARTAVQMMNMNTESD